MTTYLPTEVWRVIIRLATYIDPDDEDQMKVSHQFMQIATEFFYEITIVKKPIHAVKLSAVLTGGSTRHELMPCNPQWIKFIVVYETSKFPFWLTTADACHAFHRCNDLRGISWINYRVGLPGEESSLEPEENMLTRIPSHVQFLDWNGTIQSAMMSLLHRSSASLRVLSLGGLTNLSYSYNPFMEVPLRPINFPSLTHLKITYTVYPYYMLCMWSMPALTDLYLQDDDVQERLCRIILSRVAGTLKILRFGGTLETPQSMPTILEQCPRLQEIHFSELPTFAIPGISSLMRLNGKVSHVIRFDKTLQTSK